MKRITTLSLLTLIITSCAATPTVVKVEQEGDSQLNCEQIQKQIGEAEYYKAEARKDDTFKAKYIWLPTGVISAYRFNKAEGSAADRVEYLTSIGERKGCNLPRESKLLYDATKHKKSPPMLDPNLDTPLGTSENPVPFPR
jgi:hypothetical protein